MASSVPGFGPDENPLADPSGETWRRLIDAVGPAPTADSVLIVIWTGEGKRVRLSYRGGPRPTVGALTLRASCRRTKTRLDGDAAEGIS